MHASVVAEGLHFHYMQHTGNLSMWFHGKHVPRYKTTEGSRQFFKLGSYFIKAEYLHEEWVGQCADEVQVANRIDKRDQKYFTELLDYDVEAQPGVRWTMFPWYNLRKHERSNYEPYRNKVQRLCERYGIFDVVPYFNINWFIHNGKPLIVDCGIMKGGSFDSR
jgi:hypothetical protein